MKRSPRRGDIYWVALDPALRSEIRKTQPAVMISNDSCNAHGAKRLLQCAAVIGRDVPFALLKAIADLPPEALQCRRGR